MRSWLVWAVALLGFSLAFFRNADLDWHFYNGVGRWIVEHWALPHFEPFSFTAEGTPYRAEHWLGEVLFYLLNQLGGIQLLVTLKALLVGTIAAGVVWWAGRLREVLAAMLVTLALLGCVDQLGLRLHLLTLAFTVITLVLLEHHRFTGRGLWWVPAVAVLWVNLHGSGPLVVVLVGGYFAVAVIERTGWKPLGLCLIATGLATIATPYGWGIWREALAHVGTEQSHALIKEFAPLRARAWWEQGIAYALLAAMMACRPWRRGSARALFLCAVMLFVMTWGANRHLPLFLFAAAMFVVQASPEFQWQRSKGLKPALAALLLVLSVTVLTDVWYVVFRSDRRAGWNNVPGVLPVEALQQLRAQHLPQPLFTTYENGALVIDEAPEYKVFIDNRYRPFEFLFPDYACVAQAAPGWQQVLERWNIQTLLIDSDRLALIQALHQSPIWSLQILTGDGCVFTRDPQEISDDTLGATILHWREAHAIPLSHHFWRAAPEPWEHFNLARMAAALGQPQASQGVIQDVLMRVPEDPTSLQILSALGGGLPIGRGESAPSER